MSLRWPQRVKVSVVMPARIAGIQARTDVSGSIRVSLNSSAPCWNDATKMTLLKLAKSELTPIFEEAREVYSAPRRHGFMRAGA